MNTADAERCVAELLEDEQFANLLNQVGALTSALNRRAYDLLGFALPNSTLTSTIVGVLARRGGARLAAIASEPVVSLSAARSAKAPEILNHITASLSAESIVQISALAARKHGEANEATRSLVVRSALELGLRLMQERPQ